MPREVKESARQFRNSSIHLMGGLSLSLSAYKEHASTKPKILASNPQSFNVLF